jgi:hypothetical protein
VQSSDLDAQVNTIITKVLPAVGNTWMSALAVMPVQGNIPIEATCLLWNFSKDSLPTSILDNGVQNADLVVIVSGRLCTPDTGVRPPLQRRRLGCMPHLVCWINSIDRLLVTLTFALVNMGDRRLQDEELYDFSQVDSSNLIFESEVDRNGVASLRMKLSAQFGCYRYT